MDIDVLKRTLDPDPEPDPDVQLVELARTIAKRRTPDHAEVPIDSMQIDPGSQRPPDREKIASMAERLRAGEKLGPGKANVRPDGTVWITDGQHRVAAAAVCGHDTYPMMLTSVPSQDEPQETNLITKIAADLDEHATAVMLGNGAQRIGKRLVLHVGPTRTVSYLPHGPYVADSERGTLTVNAPNARRVLERLGFRTESPAEPLTPPVDLT